MKTEPLTLVILIPGFPKDEQDSTCLPAQQSFVLSLNKEFPDIQLIILSFQYPFEASEYLWHGNKVIAFGGKNKGGIPKFLLREKIIKKLGELDKTTKISGVLSFWCGECAMLGDHFAKKNSIPHFIWVMGQDAKKENTYVKKIKPSAHDLIAISDSIKTAFNENHGIDPEWVIPLGIDPDTYPLQNNQRTIDILCAGSLISLKRFDIAIEIIKNLKEKLPNLKAVICGMGPENKKLHTMIRHEGLTDTISMLGELPHEQLLALMAQTKILLHPSSYEGFSGVCLEALAAGMQVVSFCQPMKKEIKNWHIVKSQEEMELATLSLLRTELDYEPTLPYLMERTVRNVARLYRL